MGYTYTFTFSKQDKMIYISHLDLVRLFHRCARRAQLPVSLTLGFHPHFKIKFKRALKLGVLSENEEGEFVLEDKMDEQDILRRWQENLPQGISIKAVQQKN
jgi:radical SAM-linked protein